MCAYRTCKAELNTATKEKLYLLFRASHQIRKYCLPETTIRLGTNRHHFCCIVQTQPLYWKINTKRNFRNYKVESLQPFESLARENLEVGRTKS